MSFFLNHEDGYYTLTKAGTVSLVVLLVALIIIAAMIFDRKSVKYSVKQIAFSGVCLALAFALSNVKIVEMPWGGSITAFSMLFVCLIGYLYGPKMGLVAAFSYGILQLIQSGGEYMLSPLQVACDYLLAFMGLGVSGFFFKAKNGLMKGYIAGVIVRGIFASIAGYLYWMDYMPESFPSSLKAIYPIAYNYAYLLAEGVVTVVILCIPAVKNAFSKIKQLSN